MVSFGKFAFLPPPNAAVYTHPKWISMLIHLNVQQYWLYGKWLVLPKSNMTCSHVGLKIKTNVLTCWMAFVVVQDSLHDVCVLDVYRWTKCGRNHQYVPKAYRMIPELQTWCTSVHGVCTWCARTNVDLRNWERESWRIFKLLCLVVGSNKSVLKWKGWWTICGESFF